MESKNQNFYRSGTDYLKKPVLITGLFGIIATIAGYFIDHSQFFFSYLSAYIFWMTIVWGALFFAFLHHLTGADWSIVLRRILETVMMTIPLMAVLFIPILLGIHDLYHWSHEEAVAADPLLLKKAAYLNPVFFTIRTVIYFAIWFFLARSLYRTSLAQDNGYHENQSITMKKISAPGMILFALSITFASFDWLMSLDAHWYSTIFGVYVFGGSLLAALTFLVIFGSLLRKKGILKEVITIEHYHDLGKFLFAFIIFWGYIGFSQYFLIWYANIPEETIWYLHRWEGSWNIITMVLVFGHFLVPFLILMPRAVKRNLVVLKITSIWIIIMHWIDIYWLVLPNLHHHGVHISWMDLTATIGIGGLFIWYFLNKFYAHSLVPVNDPRLEISIRMKN
jgi:hypothetical protein